MIEREQARELVEEIDGLWDTFVPKALARHKARVLDGAIDELRRFVIESRPPVIFLLGRSGHGKSSLINALCGQEVAEVGHLEPTTPGSVLYHVTFGEGQHSWDLIDSRGLFETTSPGGGPAEDVVELTIADVLRHKPDVIMHVVSMPEVRALSNDLQALERILDRASSGLGHRIPTFMVLTRADTMGVLREWPPEEHPRKAGLIIDAVRYVAGDVLGGDSQHAANVLSDTPLYGVRLVQHPQCKAVIPLCALPEGGWNIGAVQEFIGQELPEDSQLNYYQALGRKDLLRRMSSRLTRRFAETAGFVGATPLPVADALVLTPMQLLLVMIIGGLSCRPLAMDTAKEYLAAVGGVTVAGIAFKTTAQQLVKLIPVPVAAQVISGGIAAAGTAAIGKSAEAYFFAGEVVRPDDLLETEIDERAPLVAREEVLVQAPPDAVWEVLADIDTWPDWQPGVRSATLEDPLALGSVFRWRSGRVRITSTLRVTEPNERIGWSGTALGLRSRHMWTLVPQAEGTLVVTEESLAGWVARLAKVVRPRLLATNLKAVLEALKARAESRGTGT